MGTNAGPRRLRETQRLDRVMRPWRQGWETAPTVDVPPPAPEPMPASRTFITEVGEDGKPIERFRGVVDWRDRAVRAASFTPVADREQAAMRGAARALVESAHTPNELYWFFAASAMSATGGSAVLGDLFRRTRGWVPDGDPDSLVLLEMAIEQTLGDARNEIALWRRMGIPRLRVPPAYGSTPSTVGAATAALDSGPEEAVE